MEIDRPVKYMRISSIIIAFFILICFSSSASALSPVSGIYYQPAGLQVLPAIQSFCQNWPLLILEGDAVVKNESQLISGVNQSTPYWWVSAPIPLSAPVLIFIFIGCLIMGVIIVNQSYSDRLKISFDRLGKILLYMLPVAGVCGILATILMGQYSLFLLSMYLAGPMVLSIGLYYIYSKYSKQSAAIREEVAEEYHTKIAKAWDGVKSLLKLYANIPAGEDITELDRKMWLGRISVEMKVLNDLTRDAIRINHDYRRSFQKDEPGYAEVVTDETELKKALDQAKRSYQVLKGTLEQKGAK